MQCAAKGSAEAGAAEQVASGRVTIMVHLEAARWRGAGTPLDWCAWRLSLSNDNIKYSKVARQQDLHIGFM